MFARAIKLETDFEPNISPGVLGDVLSYLVKTSFFLTQLLNHFYSAALILNVSISF